MLEIKNSKKIKKDLEKYKNAIDLISNKNVKQEYQILLKKLIEQFKLIDAAHNTTNRNIDPTNVRENVEQSVLLRQRLNKIIYDLQNLNKT